MWEETNTIEFRHFPGTLDMEEMESCIRWCQLFLCAALTDEEPPHEINRKNKFKFPKFEEYEFETEQVYQATNFDGNSRTHVAQVLDKLRKEIDIDDVKNTSSKDVYRILKGWE